MNVIVSALVRFIGCRYTRSQPGALSALHSTAQREQVLIPPSQKKTWNEVVPPDGAFLLISLQLA